MPFKPFRLDEQFTRFACSARRNEAVSFHHVNKTSCPAETDSKAALKVRNGSLAARDDDSRGLFVEIDHGKGVVSLYAHLESYDVQIGQEIEAGQQLGVVGRTGVHDSAPHLHFGLFKDGEVLNPLDHLAAYVFPPELTRRGQAHLSHPAKKRRGKHQRTR